ncbi:MAG: HIT family protein [Candidatus Firestonebacteria bacterium]
MKKCVFCKLIKEIKKGKGRSFIAELKNSYALLAVRQYFKGYCILFTKSHKEHTHKIPMRVQKGLYEDMMRVAAAIDKVFKPARFNYENLGNSTNHIHWHVIPRYKNDKYKKLPIWQIPEKVRKGKLTAKEVEEIKKKLKKYLQFNCS